MVKLEKSYQQGVGPVGSGKEKNEYSVAKEKPFFSYVSVNFGRAS